MPWLEHTRPAHVRRWSRSPVRLVEHPRGRRAFGIELGLGGFGNGSHPTTRMLVDELIERICGGERVLDVGCGSGAVTGTVRGFDSGRSGSSPSTSSPRRSRRHERNAALNGLQRQLDAKARSPDRDRRCVRHRRREHRPCRDRRARTDLVRRHRLTPSGWLAVSGISARRSATSSHGLLAAARRDRPKRVRRMGGGRLGLRSSRLGARPIRVANHLVDPDAVRFDRLHVETAPGDERVLDAEDDDPVHGEAASRRRTFPATATPRSRRRRRSSLPRAGRRGSRARRKRHLSSSRGPARFREKLDPGARAAHCGSRSRSR